MSEFRMKDRGKVLLRGKSAVYEIIKDERKTGNPPGPLMPNGAGPTPGGLVPCEVMAKKGAG